LLLDYISSTADTERAFLPFKHDGNDEVVLFVNNLGGMSELEIGGVVRAAREELGKRQIGVSRVLAGTFMVRFLLCSSASVLTMRYRRASTCPASPSRCCSSRAPMMRIR
jgi:dihydroxyacetone kinase